MRNFIIGRKEERRKKEEKGGREGGRKKERMKGKEEEKRYKQYFKSLLRDTSVSFINLSCFFYNFAV